MMDEIFCSHLGLHSDTTLTEPANKFWGVDTSFRYGGSTSILDTSAGVIDTITNLILISGGKLICNSGSYQKYVYKFIPSLDAYNSYASATGGVLNKKTGLLSITPDQYDNLQSLFFDIGGVTYEITKNAQIFPRALNKFIGGKKHGIYLIVQDISFSRQPAGISFVLGRPFLERFYTVLDGLNNHVGFATTQFTDAETN
jgi:cathepsin E